MSEEIIAIDSLQDKAKKYEAFKQNWDTEKRGYRKPDLVKPNQEGSSKYDNYQYAVITGLKTFVKELENLRRGTDKDAGIDMSFGEYVQTKLGIAPDKNGGLGGILHYLGIDSSRTTINALKSMGELDDELQWLIPETVLDAIRTGMMQNTIWRNLIASDIPVSTKTVKTPIIKGADAPLFYLNEAETIPFGNIEFAEKKIELLRLGTGFELTYDILQFVAIDLLSEYLVKVGANINNGLTAWAVQTLLNGDGNSNAASVIGTETIGSFAYDTDILRLVIRMKQLGYNVDSYVADETPLRQIMILPEFKGFSGETKLGGVTVNTNREMGVPTQFQAYPSGIMPATNQVLWLDPRQALQKFTVSGLMVESEKLISNLTQRTVVNMVTGFGKKFRDASIVMDKSLAFASNGFPAYMNPTAFMAQTFSN